MKKAEIGFVKVMLHCWIFMKPTLTSLLDEDYLTQY